MVPTYVAPPASYYQQPQPQPRNEITISLKEKERHWKKWLLTYARHGRVEELTGLVDSGCPLDLMEDKTGETALMAACRKGHLNVVSVGHFF